MCVRAKREILWRYAAFLHVFSYQNVHPRIKKSKVSSFYLTRYSHKKVNTLLSDEPPKNAGVGPVRIALAIEAFDQVARRAALSVARITALQSTSTKFSTFPTGLHDVRMVVPAAGTPMGPSFRVRNPHAAARAACRQSGGARWRWCR